MADNEANGVLTPRQHRAIIGLLNEVNVRKASEASGVPERTLYQWLKSSEFATEYRSARREAVRQAVARLQQASGAAVSVLCQLMASDKPPAVRLGAASKVLDLAIRAVELEDLEERLKALEERYAAK